MDIDKNITQFVSNLWRGGLVWIVPDISEEFGQAALSGSLRRNSDVVVETYPIDGFDAKRLFDIVMSLIILLFVLPIMMVIAAAIWMSTLGRHPVFYRQHRVGLNGKLFTLVKFRSMQVDAEKNGAMNTAELDPRITRIGRVIRGFRLDELPQLFLVLKGDMSLVGPRPERPEFVRSYISKIPGYYFRHRVKPGMTGLAQVNLGYGDSLQDAENKLFYDLNYVQTHGLAVDLNILVRTIPVVLTGIGAR